MGGVEFVSGEGNEIGSQSSLTPCDLGKNDREGRDETGSDGRNNGAYAFD